MKISAAVITYNEEKNIGRCLASLEDVADEIVVVDSFSTDATEQICSKFPTRFIKHKFDGHIEQKNYAIDQAKHDFILSLDADEELSEELKSSILEVKKNSTADAYQMNRFNNFCGQWIRHGLWYPDRKIRLWDRRKGRWGGVNPHDKVVLDQGAKTARLSGDLLHYTVADLESFYKQLDNFSSIQAEGLAKRGFRPNFIYTHLKPPLKFITSYFLRFGFLDGKAGYQIAKGLAWLVKERYRKINR